MLMIDGYWLKLAYYVFSWIIDWLELTYTEDHDDEIDLNEVEKNKQLMLHNCTRQAQMLFYGAYNWKSSRKTRLKISGSTA